MFVQTLVFVSQKTHRPPGFRLPVQPPQPRWSPAPESLQQQVTLPVTNTRWDLTRQQAEPLPMKMWERWTKCCEHCGTQPSSKKNRDGRARVIEGRWSALNPTGLGPVPRAVPCWETPTPSSEKPDTQARVRTLCSVHTSRHGPLAAEATTPRGLPASWDCHICSHLGRQPGPLSTTWHWVRGQGDTKTWVRAFLAHHQLVTCQPHWVTVS